jgi:hypothetical protein
MRAKEELNQALNDFLTALQLVNGVIECGDMKTPEEQELMVSLSGAYSVAGMVLQWVLAEENDTNVIPHWLEALRSAIGQLQPKIAETSGLTYFETAHVKYAFRKAYTEHIVPKVKRQQSQSVRHQ